VRRHSVPQRAGVGWLPGSLGLRFRRGLAAAERGHVAASAPGAFRADDTAGWPVQGERKPGGRPITGGSVETRFVPVPAARTEHFTVEVFDRYEEAVAQGGHHPVLLVGLFLLDLPTIRPFTDGNGRVVRALTNALLDDAGYTVGKYVSLEQLIAESADEYYAALLASTYGWHEQANDLWPWLAYFVDVLEQA